MIFRLVAPVNKYIYDSVLGRKLAYRTASYLMVCLLFIHFVITFYTLYQRYIYFEMREPTDSAAYMQVAFSLFYKRPFTISVQENLVSYFPYNFLGDQLMITLLLFSPLYIISSSGVVFLLAQTLIITVGGILLYLLCSAKLNKPYISLFLVGCYLFNPGTFLSFERFGFRAETLFMPLVFTIFLFVDRDKYFLALIGLTFFLLTKHNAILVAVLMGIYFVLLERSRWRLGLLCILAALFYYLIGVKGIMAHLQENPIAHFKHFAVFGATPGKAVINMICHPDKIISMISLNKLLYMGLLLCPVGLLSLFSPVFWISSSELLTNAILTDDQSIYYGWHWTLVVPFIFLGIIWSIKMILYRVNDYKRLEYFIIALLAFQMATHIVYFYNTIINEQQSFYYKKMNINPKGIHRLLEVIEPDASVMVSGQLLWHFFARSKLYNSRVRFHDEVDYIAILLPIGMPHYRLIDKYIIEEFKLHSNNGESKFNKFKVVSMNDNLLILKRK